mgnify:CR=1 FL=1
MKPAIFTLFLFLTFGYCQGQSVEVKTKVHTTKFLPRHVTYNGSPNPNECWESVAWGIEINNALFTLGYSVIDKLKVLIGDNEVEVKVVYYEEPIEGSGEIGRVVKLTLKGEIIYNEE